MPKFTILGQFELNDAIARVPPDYQGPVRAEAAPDTCYMVVLFAHDRRDVVTSVPVRRALAKIPSGEPILAVGANFTAEGGNGAPGQVLLDGRIVSLTASLSSDLTTHCSRQSRY